MSIMQKKMKMSVLTILILLLCSMNMFSKSTPKTSKSAKKIYLSFIVHGNMNYDRYVRPTIWRDFPVIYNNFLDFMDEHPDFKGQIQLSGQTFNSLKKAMPKMIDHAIALNKKGQLNFTGTFYSEPVNINMDGETNYRCAKLGTSIIEKTFGVTDGFYLQERAYHAQLPWILNNSNVSWVPVITGDPTTTYPFKVRGMDGSVTTCIPVARRQEIVEIIKSAPEKSLLVIEDDFEIPQSFSANYKKINDFITTNKDIEVEWITVKEYIKKFGIKEERYVDHSAKGKNMVDGTYSRWTADPLDIIIQDYTNKAMSAFRDATIMNSMIRTQYNKNIDIPFSDSKIELKHDPLIWNIERADLYPEVEPEFLTRDGKITLLTKAEHLLVWAVNSDSKGWFPLYEKRRERINSFVNSATLSKEIINSGLDNITKDIKLQGYDRYFILFNAQSKRMKELTLTADSPCEIFDYSSSEKQKSTVTYVQGKYKIDFETLMPEYGYKIIGLKRTANYQKFDWEEGKSIENGNTKLIASDDKVIFSYRQTSIEMSLDSFIVKALAHMDIGIGDDKWRNGVPYGKARISTRKGLNPQLRIERQIDWLIHEQQIFTLQADRVLCSIEYTFPHPTLVRKNIVKKSGFFFDPQGLTLQFKSGKPGKVFYDIPFAISPNLLTGKSYYCPLSSSIFQFDTNGGFMVTVNTGEQAFYTIPEQGEVGMYLGASTSSGPNRDVGMTIVSKEHVDHELAWYAEPFHGTYKHDFMIYPFEGTWQDNHTPMVAKSYTDEVYMREIYSNPTGNNIVTNKSIINVDKPNVEITSIEPTEKDVIFRLNEREGKSCAVTVTLGSKSKKVNIQPNGIIVIKL